MHGFNSVHLVLGLGLYQPVTVIQACLLVIPHRLLSIRRGSLVVLPGTRGLRLRQISVGILMSHGESGIPLGPE